MFVSKLSGKQKLLIASCKRKKINTLCEKNTLKNQTLKNTTKYKLKSVDFYIKNLNLSFAKCY